jgi:acyl-CoA thioesterase I
MDPTQPEWLKAALAERQTPPGARRRSRRRFLAGAGLAGVALAAGAGFAGRDLAGRAGVLPRGWPGLAPQTGLASSPGLVTLPGVSRPPTPSPAPGRSPLAAPLTYVAIGASDATGQGTRDPAREGWVPLLSQRLPAGTRLVNLGVPGITLHDAVTGVLPRAIEARPGLVTVWLVVNDLLANVPLERYRADLDRLIGSLRADTRAEVAVGNLPDPPGTLGGVQVPGFVRRTIVGQWNGAIAEVAQARGAILVDLFRRWPVGEHPEYLGPDGLHPSAAGYRTLADAFLATLRDERLLA